mmetsp:Transcript_43947/g.103980  ORF Transcript_43947/g.103980 Transcript_43947/m.103980 type:complete len:254 (-) Transcript_43947:1608-2369(-)
MPDLEPEDACKWLSTRCCSAKRSVFNCRNNVSFWSKVVAAICTPPLRESAAMGGESASGCPPPLLLSAAGRDGAASPAALEASCAGASPGRDVAGWHPPSNANMFSQAPSSLWLPRREAKAATDLACTQHCLARCWASVMAPAAARKLTKIRLAALLTSAKDNFIVSASTLPMSFAIWRLVCKVVNVAWVSLRTRRSCSAACRTREASSVHDNAMSVSNTEAGTAENCAAMLSALSATSIAKSLIAGPAEPTS